MAHKSKSAAVPETATGLTSHIAHVSRSRRDTLRELTQIEAHANREPPRNDLLPAIQLISLPIDTLRPAARKVRKDDAAQVARIAFSVGRFGMCVPVLVDSERTIIDGHQRWAAAQQVGLTEIPCIRVDHLSPADIRTLRIGLNRIAERGSWSADDLRIEMQELVLLGQDLVVTGFEMAEIDMLILETDAGIGGDTDDLEVAPMNGSVSRPGDLWQLGDHLLVQGDARDPGCYRVLMADEQARLILTDVPYNVPNLGHVTSDPRHREFAMAAGEMDAAQFAAFNRDWMSAAAAHLVEGGLLGTTIDWRSVELVLAVGRDLGFGLINLIVWTKSNAGQGSLWRSQHELLPVFKKGTAAHVNNIELGKNGRWRSNVWPYPGGSSLGSDSRDGLNHHPTVKPRAMIQDALIDVTNRGDIVIDCFCGSGTTVLAAEAVGRRCRAIELDGHYCDIIIQRWQEMSGQDAILRETGETFAAVAHKRGDHAANSKGAVGVIDCDGEAGDDH